MNNSPSKMDAASLHLSNKKLILAIIKKNGQVSRSELSKITGLTPPTVSRIVDEIINTHNLAEYIGFDSSKGGRPSLMIKFKNENNFIIGIDLGATYIRGCLVDLNAQIISEIQVPTEIDRGFNHIIEIVVKLIHKIQKRKNENDKIWGVGIGVAGLVNSSTGIIESSPDFGWTDIDLNKEVGERIDLPLYYDNSTRLMALGELNLGNYQNVKNFALINVGYGIAAGIVIRGNILKGQNGFAGEIGHIPVDKGDLVKCKCGMYDCLEAHASGHRIANLGKAVYANKDASILNKLCENNPDLISAELVSKAAQLGDVASIKIYNDIADYLCKGIGSLVNILNPKIIYIGGGVSLSGEFFFDLINSKISKYLLDPNSNVEIHPSSFGENATTIGSVSLILEKIMDLEL